MLPGFTCCFCRARFPSLDVAEVSSPLLSDLFENMVEIFVVRCKCYHLGAAFSKKDVGTSKWEVQQTT